MRHRTAATHRSSRPRASASPPPALKGGQLPGFSLAALPGMSGQPVRREDTRPSRAPPRAGLLGVVLAAEFRCLRLTSVPGFLEDGRDIRVGDEVLPARRIPVEEHPDTVIFIGIAEHGRTLRTVLLSFLSAFG